MTRVCIEPGCPHLATEGARCGPHAAAYQAHKDRTYDAGRPSARKRGYDERHREWRAKVLARDRACQGWPHMSGCGQPADTADHIQPMSEGGRRLDMRNGRGMCSTCHNRKRQEESTRAKRRNG